MATLESLLLLREYDGQILDNLTSFQTKFYILSEKNRCLGLDRWCYNKFQTTFENLKLHFKISVVEITNWIKRLKWCNGKVQWQVYSSLTFFTGNFVSRILCSHLTTNQVLLLGALFRLKKELYLLRFNYFLVSLVKCYPYVQLLPFFFFQFTKGKGLRVCKD